MSFPAAGVSNVQEYERRLDARRAARATLIVAEARFVRARLITAFSAALSALLAWHSVISPWWLLIPAAVFGWLVRRHDRVLQRQQRVNGAIAFYECALARLHDDWVGTGECGERFRDEHHVYADDLDLFGRGSLFELLSRARTRSGEDTLASWLTQAGDPSDIAARQLAVDELAFALDLRERLATCGGHDRRVDCRALLDWAESPTPHRRVIRVVCVWFFTIATAAATLYFLLTLMWAPLVAIVVVYMGVLRRFREATHRILPRQATGEAYWLDHLPVIAELLTHLEGARFDNARLVRLQQALLTGGRATSRIQQVHGLFSLYDGLRNTVMIPLGLFLIGKYTGREWLTISSLPVAALLVVLVPHVVLAVETWLRRWGGQVRSWLDTIAEYEALASLACYRFEHADDPFPEVLSGDAGAPPQAFFEAVQLRHPLLSRSSAVANDVRLGDIRLLVVSGSNMSGKSTLLRAVGVNAVMALAGAPVAARSLQMAPLAIGATLRIHDSLREGRSRFYAEITRIRTLTDVARGPVPLLFLLDEILSGTNSHDRMLGAQGVLRYFLDCGAIGLITTHDLALTAIVDQMAPRARNVHFQDDVKDSAVTFDYVMRPGPVQRSNALALMRLIGLDVPLPRDQV